MTHTNPSKATPTPASTPVDRLGPLLARFRVRAQLFHEGPLCGETRYPAVPGRGFLHVMRSGALEVRHTGRGVPRRLRVAEPCLLFYPRPIAHAFHTPAQGGCDFVCAALEFEGGALHPLVRALPPLVLLRLAQAPGLAGALQLLFDEADQVRCGHRLMANRLLEVVLLHVLRWLLDHPEEGGVSAGLLAGLADPALARALTAMHEAPGETWSMEALARQAGLSRSTFFTRFRQVVGDTPSEYLAAWRMALAQTRLREGVPVKVLAGELGYANASALSRVFASKVGMSPRRWLAS